MSEPALRAEFVGRAPNRIFVLLRRPPGVAAGCFLVVPPFAEEMNKSRRMVTDLSQALVANGCAAATLDLFGTGDSDGEFREASWARWVADVGAAADWCAAQGVPVTGLVGVRLGCALAAEVAASGRFAVRTTVLWQPVLDGARALDQFLRLRVAASLMEEDHKETVKDLRARLRAFEPIEVAGYTLSPELTRALEGLQLTTLLDSHAGTVHWLDVVRELQPGPGPATATALEALQARGVSVKFLQVVGDYFWSTTEITVAPALIAATVARLREAA